jgi:hypothetical protein
MTAMRIFLTFLLLFLAVLPVSAQEDRQLLTSSNIQIEWKVTNRFRLFRNADAFRVHERAWIQYGIHAREQRLDDDGENRLLRTTSVIGTEHVLNDRYISFSRILRKNYESAGWASKQVDDVCWSAKTRTHSACDGVENYVLPKFHEIEMKLRLLKPSNLIGEYNCDWRIGNGAPITAPCDEAVTGFLPYPGGDTISVNVDGEAPIQTDAQVKDLLIVGMGDSFASGEGNPDVAVEMSGARRHNNLYPKRARNDNSGSAQWLDEPCHRSLYGHQLRAALQIAIENPQSAVTFMGYACSGAAVDEGLLGPQEYVDYVGRGDGTAQAVKGGKRDTQLRWLLRELCAVKPERDDGLWTCPDNQFRRKVDFLFLSIGGNDIGFSSLVTWATLRDSATATLAKFLGATVSPKQFAANMKNDLPDAYAKLAKALEKAVPLVGDGLEFDPSRVILTSYPDILEDERGNVCPAGSEGDEEDRYTANQSLDLWQNWLVVTDGRIGAAHEQLANLHQRMGELAEDHGWTFAARAYADRAFRGHGFCAQNKDKADDPAEVLMIPCWGKADRPTLSCESSWSGKERNWRPFNPETQNYPYALRQRWVRTFNDAYMIINKKVTDKAGNIDEKASAAIFSETTGAMHPSAEGHAAMADAILIDIRAAIAKTLGKEE